MKLALAQINTKVGDFKGNLNKIVSSIRHACLAGAELVVFPELSLTGYPPRDLLDCPAFVEANLKALQEVAAHSHQIAVIVGYVDRVEGEGQKKLVNGAAFCEGGKVVQKYAKRLVPSYDVFDEGRHFTAGREPGLFNIRGKMIGISICEDAWNPSHFLEKRLYPFDPIEEQVKGGASLLINISASPFAAGKGVLRRRLFESLAARHHVPFYYVNLVGGNDELLFDGRSLVITAEGKTAIQGRSFGEDLIIVETEQIKTKGVQPDDELEEISQALVLGLKDYLKKCGFRKVVLGLSGGIDSSLVAQLACRALGPKNVLGVLMPSPFTSRASLEDARILARNLGMPTRKIPITPVYRACRRTLKAGKKTDLADENLQARIRGNILMFLSNRHGHLVLSTGNKSELAVGYCTLYGDMSGGLAVISDLFKTTVYALARHLNAHRQVIPQRVFEKAPSAELRPGQTDQDSLPPYPVLDPILQALIEEWKSEDEVVAMGFKRTLVRQVCRLVDQNEYKRRQAAPGLKVTSKAFGMGRRLPIARKF